MIFGGTLGRKRGLACFSPEVMLATFVIELVLALYVYFRHRTGEFGRVVFAILLLLAVFQFAEYQICQDVFPLIWARIGFVAITFLPVLGLHLLALAGRPTDLVKAGYVLALSASVAMIFFPDIINGGVCWGNYVVFQTAPEMQLVYGIYYFSFLFLGLFKAGEAAWDPQTPKAVKPMFYWFIAGYLAFLLPTGIAYALDDGTRNAIPSVMCGFALLYAFILVWRVLPIYGMTRGRERV